jgi:hypothetical protein
MTMNKDTIVQFVCFVSPLERAEFMDIWQPFASQLGGENLLLQEVSMGKESDRHCYVSKHTCKTNDFSFAFMKGKRRSQFPEHKSTVKQVGGYLPLQIQATDNKAKGDVKIIAFVSQGERELNFYQQLSFHRLNIFEAYYENCAYGYVMEFFVKKEEAPALLTELNARTGVEAALYKECHSSVSSKKVSRLMV